MTMRTAPDLGYVPGPTGLPVIGHTVPFLRDARALLERCRQQYGDVFRLRSLSRETIVFLTPDATRDIYLDTDRCLSSEDGWSFTIGPLFRRGLMLRDFDDHHRHRLVMAQAFRRAALEGYTDRIHDVVDRHVDRLGAGGPVDVYATMKAMTLDIAAEVFVGASLGGQTREVNEAFVAMMAASVWPVRVALPGSRWARGMAGRARLQRLFAELVTERRSRPESADLLSRLAHAQGEDGRLLPADEVVDHMIFLLLAAHDTTTATLAVMLSELARRPEWQDRLLAEMDAVVPGGRVAPAEHPRLVDLGRVFREATRLSPPVPFSPRGVLADTAIGGWEVPAGATVSAASLGLHVHPDWWTDPYAFDPDRFGPDRAEDKAHSHLFVPFGGGAHLCIGNHLAELMAKIVVVRLLGRHRLAADPADRVPFRPVPIPKPARPLLVNLHARADRVTATSRHRGGPGS